MTAGTKPSDGSQRASRARRGGVRSAARCGASFVVALCTTVLLTASAAAQTPSAPSPEPPSAKSSASQEAAPAARAETAPAAKTGRTTLKSVAKADLPAVAPSSEEIAARLLAGTVTIRVALPSPQGAAGNNARNGSRNNEALHRFNDAGLINDRAAGNNNDRAAGNTAADPSNNAASPPGLRTGNGRGAPVFGPVPPPLSAGGSPPTGNPAAPNPAANPAPNPPANNAASVENPAPAAEEGKPSTASEVPAPAVSSATRTPPAAPPVVPPTANGSGAVPQRGGEARLDNNRAYGEVIVGNNSPAANGYNGLAFNNGLALNNTLNNDAGGVIVASGASLGNGLILGWMNVPAESRVRVTLPRDGESLDARLRVVDHYTGLVLLRVGRLDLPHLDLAADLPTVGGTLYAAAAAGIDEPLVSQGILGGSARAVGTILPPLLPCDLRTTIASSGAPVVDRHGMLVGVVASNDAANERGGWTYVVPIRHLQRLLAFEPASDDAPPAVLERRRPELGLTMFTTETGAVQVERVRPGGPAAAAGIREGDLVLETDGLKVRSVYQAVAVVLRKQPGDQVAFLVRRADKEVKFDVTLAVGGRMAPPPAQSGQRLAGAYAQIRSVGPNAVEVQGYLPQNDQARQGGGPAPQGAQGSGAAQGNGAPQVAQGADLPQQQGRLARDEMSLLREQLNRWSQALVQLRGELDRRDDAVRTLQARVRQLEEQLQQTQSAPAPEPKSQAK